LREKARDYLIKFKKINDEKINYRERERKQERLFTLMLMQLKHEYCQQMLMLTHCLNLKQQPMKQMIV